MCIRDSLDVYGGFCRRFKAQPGAPRDYTDAYASCVACGDLSVFDDNNAVLCGYDPVSYTHLDTWLPYIFFFLIGAVTGYVKDRLRSENRFLSEEKQILEDKYILLNEDVYKRQILKRRF